MQRLPELFCEECKSEFESAASLLQHFASHVVENYNTDLSGKKSKVPNLYPISRRKTVESENGSDNKIEELNPIKLCIVTLKENEDNEKVKTKMVTENTLKKYQCMYCLKRFGWSTDLKRHVLIHTGERPFVCQLCNSSFTRNFLLQKHQLKVHHSGNNKGNIPDLKPISEILNKKSRKQQKFQIKRKTSAITNGKSIYNLKKHRSSLVCSN